MTCLLNTSPHIVPITVHSSTKHCYRNISSKYDVVNTLRRVSSSPRDLYSGRCRGGSRWRRFCCCYRTPGINCDRTGWRTWSATGSRTIRRVSCSPQPQRMRTCCCASGTRWRRWRRRCRTTARSAPHRPQRGRSLRRCCCCCSIWRRWPNRRRRVVCWWTRLMCTSPRSCGIRWRRSWGRSRTPATLHQRRSSRRTLPPSGLSQLMHFYTFRSINEWKKKEN